MFLINSVIEKEVIRGERKRFWFCVLNFVIKLLLLVGMIFIFKNFGNSNFIFIVGFILGFF